MPPKKAPAKKLHELCTEVRVGFKINDITKKTFVVGKQFATGGFGRIHLCTEEGKSAEMVMKIEPASNGPLTTEVVVFNRILKKEHLEAYKKKNKIDWLGLPYGIGNGIFTYEGEKLRYMVMPKYATSLEAVREANEGSLTTRDALSVSNCVLGALQYLHDVDYAHADIKAANILLEKQGDCSTAVLVDFGLARRTISNVDKPDKKRAHNGTCIFTSTDAHRGNNPSFRGDVEILAYNIIMWLNGTMPWMALEASPDKVFDAKQKLIAGLPTTLQSVLKTQSSAVIGCVTTMFNESMTTNYTSKMDMDKLKKLVKETIQKTPAGGKKKTTEEEKKEVPQKKSSRRAAAVREEDKEEEEEVSPKKKVSTRNQKPRKTVEHVDEEEMPKKKAPVKKTPGRSRKRLESSDEEEEEIIPKSTKSRRNIVPAENDLSPSSERGSTSRRRLGTTPSPTATISAAKKIEQRYKRLSMNKASSVPVTVSISSQDSASSPGSSSSRAGTKRSSDAGLKEEIVLKTPVVLPPAIKKTKYKSGISSATKASPTELRRVPGVRNFPKGRRSMIIKETSAKYQERRAARQAKPTFNDSSVSNSSEL